MKKILLVVISMILVIFSSSCANTGSKNIEGAYEQLFRSDYTVVFKQKTTDSGTFFLQEEEEKVEGEWRVRNEDGILEGVIGQNILYFKVFDDCLVGLGDSDGRKENEIPLNADLSSIISNSAPKGDTFNWEWSQYKFYDNGECSYEFGERQGNYYVKGNIIYINGEPMLYILNENCVSYVSIVFVKNKDV